MADQLPFTENVRAGLPEKASAPPVLPATDLQEMVRVWTTPAQWAVVGLVVLAAAFLGLHSFLAGASGPQASALERSPLADARIDLKRAERAELLQLPGVGESLADRILEHRERVGFKKYEDLLAVPGIGPALLHKLREYVTVGSDEGTIVSAKVKDEPPPPIIDNKARVDLNRASREELEKLPGIGPKLAERIIAERRRQPFKKIDELDRVLGIGPKTLARLRPHVTVSPLEAPDQP